MLILTALLFAAPLAHELPPLAQCSLRGRGSSVNISAHDDDDSSTITIVRSENGRCTQATLVGRIRYSENEDDIVSMTFGSHATFSERTSSGERDLVVQPGEGGAIVHVYRHNGRSAPWDADAQRWLAEFLPRVLMEAGVNVGPRVARWRAQGGVDRVLSQIATIKSSGAKRKHYAAVLTAESPNRADVDKIVRHAGRNIASSGDLRGILELAADGNGPSGPALADAASHIASSGDKSAVLRRYGQTDDHEMLRSVLREVRTVASSGDKSTVLRAVVARCVGVSDRELATAWFDGAVTVPSSGDLHRVLRSAAPAASADELVMLIRAAAHVGSSGDRSRVLLAVVDNDASRDDVVHKALVDAAAGIPSSGDRSRVLEAIMRRR